MITNLRMELFEALVSTNHSSPGDAGLAVEDDGAGGGGLLQHGDDLVKVGLHGRLLLVGGDPGGPIRGEYCCGHVISSPPIRAHLMGSNLGTFSLMAE